MPQGQIKSWRERFGGRLPSQGFALSAPGLLFRRQSRLRFPYRAQLWRMFRSAAGQSSDRQVASFQPWWLLRNRPPSPPVGTSKSPHAPASALQGGLCQPQPLQPSPSPWRRSGTFSGHGARLFAQLARFSRRRQPLAPWRSGRSFAAFAGCRDLASSPPAWSFRRRPHRGHLVPLVASQCPSVHPWVRLTVPAGPRRSDRPLARLMELVSQPRLGHR